MKRTLFLSFKNIIRGLADNHLTDEMLKNGLFFLGCTRSHALDPSGPNNEVSRFFPRDPAAGLAAHRRVTAALEAAESDFRAIWHRDMKFAENYDAYSALDELLKLHGHQPLVHSPQYVRPSHFSAIEAFVSLRHSKNPDLDLY